MVVPNPTPGPNTDLDQYIEQWQQAQNQYNQDYAYLVQMIQQMLALAKQGGNGTEEAFQIAEDAVMPSAMSVQGDATANIAAAMNIGSAIMEFVTDSQNLVNNGSKVTVNQAAQFIQYLQQLYDTVKGELQLPANQQWMDPNTANNIISALDKVAGEFEVGATPDTLGADPAYYATIIATDIQDWTNNPTTISNGQDQNAPPNETGQQHMQNIQADVQQWNNTVGAQSQALTAQEQFATNTYNQYMNACTDIFQSTQQQAQDFVQNQKSQ